MFFKRLKKASLRYRYKIIGSTEIFFKTRFLRMWSIIDNNNYGSIAPTYKHCGISNRNFFLCRGIIIIRRFLNKPCIEPVSRFHFTFFRSESKSPLVPPNTSLRGATLFSDVIIRFVILAGDKTTGACWEPGRFRSLSRTPTNFPKPFDAGNNDFVAPRRVFVLVSGPRVFSGLGKLLTTRTNGNPTCARTISLRFENPPGDQWLLLRTIFIRRFRFYFAPRFSVHTRQPLSGTSM